MSSKFPKLAHFLVNEPPEKILNFMTKINFGKNNQSKFISKESLEGEFTNVYLKDQFVNNKPSSKPFKSYKSKFQPKIPEPSAAVFVLTYFKDQNLNVLLCERANRGKHGGELGFPGGKKEVNESIEECLFRETFEEIKLSSKENSLKILNNLPYSFTFVTQIMVQPFLGTFDRNSLKEWITDKNEIEKVIEIPIIDLIKNYKESAPMYQMGNDYVYEINGPQFDLSTNEQEFGTNRSTIW